MSFKGCSIGIIGFNARPIACSAKRLGAKVYVSDYWGDSDLGACCDDWTAINSPAFDKVEEMKVSQALVENFRAKFIDCDIDYVVVGSGFDDHYMALKRISENWQVMGNTGSRMETARNPKVLSKLADELEINYPNRLIANSKSSLIRACKRIRFPCVMRSIHSGGGSRIHLLLNLEQAIELYQQKERKNPVVIQEYINGIDASCSVISTGNDVKVISIQGQLIGMPSAGRNNDFVYCGNYWPLEISRSIQSKIKRVSESICKSIGLIGSNGFDFMIRDDEIFLMEINPRIQGTLEMLELSSNASILEMHLNACNGRLPTKRIELKPVVKMIVYARHDGICPDLSQFPHTFDLTPTGMLVERRSPICTIITIEKSLEAAYGIACKIASSIQMECKIRDNENGV